MARSRRTLPPPNQGPNRIAQMRNTTERNRPGRAFGPQGFQGGLGSNAGVGPQQLGQPPVQNSQQCPPGQMPGKDPNTGAQTCVPATRPQGFGQRPPRTGAGIPGANRNKPPKVGY